MTIFKSFLISILRSIEEFNFEKHWTAQFWEALETNFDIVYIDMIKTNLTATALKISELYLKKSGYLFLIIPTTEIVGN